MSNRIYIEFERPPKWLIVICLILLLLAFLFIPVSFFLVELGIM